MHSSQHAAPARRSPFGENRTGDLSFPPTQRTCLLCSPPPSAPRSNDQVLNLLHSSDELLNMLNALPLAHAASL